MFLDSSFASFELNAVFFLGLFLLVCAQERLGLVHEPWALEEESHF